MQNVNISLEVCSIMTLWRSRKESWDVSSHLCCAPALRCHQLWQRCKTSLFHKRNSCFNVFWRTIFRLLRTSDFTSRQQNVNITLYLFHFMQTCCELPRLHEIPLPGPCRKSHCLGPRNFIKLLHFRYHLRVRVAISSTTQRNETGIT